MGKKENIMSKKEKLDVFLESIENGYAHDIIQEGSALGSKIDVKKASKILADLSKKLKDKNVKFLVGEWLKAVANHPSDKWTIYQPSGKIKDVSGNPIIAFERPVPGAKKGQLQKVQYVIFKDRRGYMISAWEGDFPLNAESVEDILEREYDYYPYDGGYDDDDGNDDDGNDDGDYDDDEY
jgi:hypothetical protein